MTRFRKLLLVLQPSGGGLYWGKVKSFLKYASVFEGNSTPLNISQKDGLDINNYNDWKKLIELYSLKNDTFKI